MKAVSTLATAPSRIKLANYLFPRYNLRLDQVNSNALLKAWIEEHSDIPVLPDKLELYRFISGKYVCREAINYLEFGVYEGASIRAWAALEDNPRSRFIGFDSFSGLPEAWGFAREKGAFDVGGAIPEVRDSRTSFVQGWFQKTLVGFLEKFDSDKRLVIHNDSDLYSSTAYCLAKLDPIIQPGTIIIFDEFNSALHEFRAWNDYLRAFMRKAKPIAMTARYAEQVAFIFE